MSETISPCCDEVLEGSEGNCALCEEPGCGNCFSTIRDQPVCASCVGKIEAELQAEKGGALSLPIGIAGGAGGALIGGLLWGGVSIATNLEIGYVAIAVGWLAGQGVVFATGGKRGPELQMVAAISSIFGLLVGKYLSLGGALMDYMDKEEGVEISYAFLFSAEMLSIFMESVGDMMGPFDLLWIFLALGIAWRTPARSTF